MLTLTSCPQCGAPAEITERFVLASTDGPVPHVALACVARHHFRMEARWLPGIEPNGTRESRDGAAVRSSAQDSQ